MIEKVLEYNNLGTKTQILYIINLLSKGNFNKNELFQACASKEYTYSNSFDGIILLLVWLDVIEDRDQVYLIKEFTYDNFLEEFSLLFFSKLSKESKLHSFINNKNMIFNRELNCIFIKNNLIKLRFSPFRNLLLGIGLLDKDHLIEHQFIVNHKVLGWFIEVVIPLIEKSERKNMSLVNLESQHHKQKELGFEAELFVLEYEKRNRVNHVKNNNIQIISEVDVSAGYDILSYQTDQSILLDKFIEVKSFSGKESFFWSRNEMDVARIKKDEYYLYLVNRDKMKNKDYKPTIIQNPHDMVLSNEKWNKRIEKYFISI